jgi:anti-sigma-K factor RskA
MSTEMTHDEVRAALAAEALGSLDAAESEVVSAHLTDCAECRAELEAYREASGALAYAAPAAAMAAERSSAIRGRLLERAAADRASRASSRSELRGPALSPASPPILEPEATRAAPIRRLQPRATSSGWLAAAACLTLAIAAGAYAVMLQGRLSGLQGELATARDKAREAVAEVGRRDEIIASLSGRGVRIIDLASTQQQAPSGRMFWDPATDRWTFYAYNLPQVRAGRAYELWLITPQGPVAAGTFTPEAGGRATVHATYDLPADQLRAVAVTEEPEAGVAQPTGEILILGNAATD